MGSILDLLHREFQRVRMLGWDIKRVRVTPTVTQGQIAPRGREVWVHPADLHGILMDRLAHGALLPAMDSLMGIPVVHGFKEA